LTRSKRRPGSRWQKTQGEKRLSNRTELCVKKIVVGPMETNCYIVSDSRTKDAFVIDPGADAGRIKKTVEKDGLSVKFIVNTHGHGDHIAANAELKAPIYIHRLDAAFLADPKKNLSAFFFFSIRSPEASRFLDDGDTVDIGSTAFKVLHTPGHTPGSISLVADGVAFTGDTLFRESVGRTDFEYGDEGAIIKSITQKLFGLPDDTVVYPGHGEESTIGHEKKNNPFFT
jgi:glyoxylase-like metal-dependent hydrolase (beta-lactamase superfamily II)